MSDNKARRRRQALGLLLRRACSVGAVVLPMLGAVALDPLAAQPAASPATPAADDRPVADAPLLETYAGPAAGATRMARDADAARRAGETHLELNVVYTDSRLFNPASGRKEPVRLRSYQGATIDPLRPYVAPTIEVRPGETVRVTLNNRLPADPACTRHDGDVNVPHCFNGTNLHAHGLWVSPAGNSDNVLLSINPGVSFEYEYNIPPDHPAGTFWYHSHRHGSTALQVASGMAGALIVRGDRLPSRDGSGDLDTLLRNPDGTALTERVLVLQQIQYACLDARGRIKVERNAAGEAVAWVCEEGDVGGIEFYDNAAGDAQFGPGTWAQSGRYTSINGVVLPAFAGTAGRVERWRLIHAGVRDTISLEVRALKPDALPPEGLKAGDVAAWIDASCTGPALPYHLVAADGLTMAAAQSVTRATLQPGYRLDALLAFPEPGKYCLINASVPAPASVSRREPGRRLLGVARIEGGTPVTDVGRHVTRTLVAAARRQMPKPVRAVVVADLENGLRLDRFVPHADVADAELTGRQELTFFIDTQAEPARFEVDGQPYVPQRIDRVLRLGGADEWTLRSRFASHPFHIHVNPFQIVRILDPHGRDVSAPGAIDDAGGAPDPQYPGLRGVWKDTLWIKSLIPPQAEPQGLYTVVLRTRYQRYLGDFVLHCHILDHEDRGMMQNVRIALPDGEGGVAPAHH